MDQWEWKDRSIIAQTSAKVAAEVILSPQFDPAGLSPTEAFKEWQKVVFDNTLALAGPHPDVEAKAVAAVEHQFGATAETGKGYSGGQQVVHDTGENPLPAFGKTVLKFGKHKGMTLHEIANSSDGDGNDGRSYIEWLAENAQDEFFKKAAKGYLNATK